MSVTLAELARRFQGRVRGNPDLVIKRAASLDSAGPDDITYLSDRKYLAQLASTAADIRQISLNSDCGFGRYLCASFRYYLTINGYFPCHDQGLSFISTGGQSFFS